MMLGRRSLLGAMAGTAAFAMCESAGVAAAARRKVKKFGIQLYTLREAAKTDPIGVLRKLKKLGYSEVELAGPPYSAMDAKQLRRELMRIGLTAPSMHAQMKELQADAAKVFAWVETIGCDYVVLPYIGEEYRSTIAQCQATAKQLTKFGAEAKAAGVTFAYHNHQFEFEPVEGKLPFDIFFDESDPALVKIELDLHWASKAKADIPAIFSKYAGRIPLCHVKDITEEGKMVAPGEGVIDFAKLFALSGQAGLVHYFVEHDNPPSPYWPTVEAAANYMKKLRY